jgi:hypothetical protein
MNGSVAAVFFGILIVAIGAIWILAGGLADPAELPAVPDSSPLPTAYRETGGGKSRTGNRTTQRGHHPATGSGCHNRNDYPDTHSRTNAGFCRYGTGPLPRHRVLPDQPARAAQLYYRPEPAHPLGCHPRTIRHHHPLSFRAGVQRRLPLGDDIGKYQGER